jgi:hypothetical protein
MIFDVALAASTWSNLLGMRVTQVLRPDVAALAERRMDAILDELDRADLRNLVIAGLNLTIGPYVLRDERMKQHEADNVARALLEAEKAGVL